MSIKRSRTPAYHPRRGDDVPARTTKKAEPEKTWEQHMADQPDSAFEPWALARRFEKGQLLAHATFGKGVVLSAGPTVIEVLFEGGKKKLGHNMPPGDG